MSRLERFSTLDPIQFSLLITLMVLALYVGAAVFAELFGTTTVGRNLIEALGRFVGAVFFVFVILRFKWLEKTGLSRLGPITVWLFAMAILFYEVITHVYPLMGDFDLGNIDTAESASVALNAVTTGFIEEIPFRGIILYAFIRLWADSKEGILKSVLLSALIFGGSHLVHVLLGRPIPQATLIALNASLAGIYYAAIVLRWNTIWPAVAIHSSLNAIASIVAFNTPGFNESIWTLLLAVVFQIPVVILGGYLISRIKAMKVVSNTI